MISFHHGCYNSSNESKLQYRWSSSSIIIICSCTPYLSHIPTIPLGVFGDGPSPEARLSPSAPAGVLHRRPVSRRTSAGNRQQSAAGRCHGSLGRRTELASGFVLFTCRLAMAAECVTVFFGSSFDVSVWFGVKLAECRVRILQVAGNCHNWHWKHECWNTHHISHSSTWSRKINSYAIVDWCIDWLRSSKWEIIYFLVSGTFNCSDYSETWKYHKPKEENWWQVFHQQRSWEQVRFYSVMSILISCICIFMEICIHSHVIQWKEQLNPQVLACDTQGRSQGRSHGGYGPSLSTWAYTR